MERGIILNTPFITDWEAIRLRKQKRKKITKLKKKCKPHIYRILGKVEVRNEKTNNHEEPYVYSYPITQVWTNGNTTIRRGAIQEHTQIRWIKPYNK